VWPGLCNPRFPCLNPRQLGGLHGLQENHRRALHVALVAGLIGYELGRGAGEREARASLTAAAARTEADLRASVDAATESLGACQWVLAVAGKVVRAPESLVFDVYDDASGYLHDGYDAGLAADVSEAQGLTRLLADQEGPRSARRFPSEIRPRVSLATRTSICADEP
jgi:hypothetical protein